MNSIYQRIPKGDWEKTIYGSTDRDDAIRQMITLCAIEIAAVQKKGKRVQLQTMGQDGLFIIRVCDVKNVLISYCIKS
jgi:hypothetical protein